LPEPSAADLPRTLGGAEDDLIESAHQIARIQREMAEAQAVIDTTTTFGWELLTRAWNAELARETRALETCQLRDVRSHRDRIAFLRYMLELPSDLARKIREKTDELQALQLEDDEGDDT
jgi:hypothetical protein